MTGFLLLVGLGLIQLLEGGVVLKILWGWFVAPIFNLPPLSIPVAMGLATIWALLAATYVPKTKDEEIKSVVYGFLIPLICLLLGFIVHLFM